MPLKDFECQSCRHKFEVLVWLRDPDPTACPKCGAKDLKQLLGSFKVIGLGKKSSGLSADADAGGEGGMDDAALGGGFDQEMGGGMDDDPGGGMDDMGGDEDFSDEDS